MLGSQRAVLIGGIVITLGHLLLGFAPSTAVFFLGLLVIVIGTGLLKPNATALVAQLYPEGGARRDAGFTIYYVGVNVGATIGPLIAGLLARALRLAGRLHDRRGRHGARRAAVSVGAQAARRCGTRTDVGIERCRARRRRRRARRCAGGLAPQR